MNPPKSRMHILVMIGVYLPGNSGGGPIKSVSNLVKALGSDFDFDIVTSDRDLNSSKPYLEIKIGDWNSIGNSRVMYLKRGVPSLLQMYKIIRDGHYDLIYLNSFFDSHFSIFPVLVNRLMAKKSMPVLLAPRGEFSPGALGLKKLKKYFYIKLSKLIGLYKNITWHASTANEANDIRHIFSPAYGAVSTARVISASDIANISTSDEVNNIASDNSNVNLRVCFLSRIAKMKNLHFALDLLKQFDRPLTFSVYGPLEDSAYWEECQRSIKSLPTNIKVEYHGSVDTKDVVKTISSHDIFILPTLGENYGHVIVEAWAAGVPVLISDRTPWKNLEGRKIGWDIPLSSPELFRKALMTACQWNADEWREAKSACRKEADSIINNADVVNDNKLMFLNAINHVA